MKYLASELLRRARSIADLQNSSFITWGDEVQMLNTAYRQVYQDLIQAGELSYLKEVRLAAYGTSKFKLPDDFYQMAMLCDDYGNEIPLRRLASSVADIGYEIANGCITLHNVRNNVVLKYYPNPYMITYKAGRTDSFTLATPVSGFGDEVLLSDGRVFDIKKQAYTVSTTHTYSNPILCKDAIVSGNTVYWKTGATADSVTYPIVTSDGNILSGSDYGVSYPGWSNPDGTVIYYKKSNVVYCQSEGEVTTITTRNVSDARVTYFDNHWCLITSGYIYYPDGTYLTTESKGIVLKTDYQTGYGMLVRTGSNTYAVEGFTPDTMLDYPDNVLFDIVAYKIAIQYRMKQNSDASAIINQVNDMMKTYLASLSNTKDYPVIRNVDGRYKFGWF